MHYCTALLLVATLAGCASNGQRIDRSAESAGLSRMLVDAGKYPGLIYMKRGQAAHDATLVVFLEGDGRPWRDGREPAADPTTRHPVALELLLRTPRAAAYVTRPCYHGLQAGRCTPEQWTGARYSQDIVISMAAAIREAMRRADARELILVGYSGGGVLAVLIAERLDQVAAVITLAANLDTDAWTQHHRYLQLTQSLNPALSDRAHSWREIHLHGARDVVVPPATTAAYFKRYSAAQQRIIDDYDHVCCWVDHWPSLWSSLGLLRGSSLARGEGGVWEVGEHPIDTHHEELPVLR